MSYPYDKTYLQQIKSNHDECEHIRSAYHILCSKFERDNNRIDDDLTITERFALLGEAFEHESYTLNGVGDDYHFLWDVVDTLLESDKDKASREEREAEWNGLNEKKENSEDVSE